MFKKKVLLSLCLLFSISFASVNFAEANIIMPNSRTPIIYNVDIPSGYNANGTAYGLARMAQLRERIHGTSVTIESIAKVGHNQYQINCTSKNPYCNGAFIVDVFPGNENVLKEGYQLWFSVFDPAWNKLGTAQVKRK